MNTTFRLINGTDSWANFERIMGLSKLPIMVDSQYFYVERNEVDGEDWEVLEVGPSHVSILVMDSGSSSSGAGLYTYQDEL
jgi:hypothetical protein